MKADKDQHPLDGVAQDLGSWMGDMVAYGVDAMKGGHRAPFAAPVSEKEKRDYYTRKVFNTNPDGTTNYDSPNTQGRDTLLKLLGTSGYAKVIQSVMPQQGVPPPPEAESALGGQIPTDQIDQPPVTG